MLKTDERQTKVISRASTNKRDALESLREARENELLRNTMRETRKMEASKVAGLEKVETTRCCVTMG